MFLKENNPYAGGEFVFKDGDPEIGTWFTGALDADAVFHATFIPHPATLVLLGLGFAGMVGLAARGGRR
jgi:hypothetical protein